MEQISTFSRPLRANALSLLLLLIALLGMPGCEKPDEPPFPPINTTAPHWVNQRTPHADIALVFVHGIFGDTLGTWQSKRGSFFDLLAVDDDIGPKVDMYAFGYTSKMLGEGSFGIDEAANTLYARLETSGVLEYPAVVFINHSMGGLVVMQLLSQHLEMIPQVPSVVFFSTPQTGADIARIAQHISINETLRNMLPGDSNAFIRTLDDRWKAIDPAIRPRVYCAYEKLDTFGIKIVDWAAGTRHCDGPALAINANHISIVKPDDANHDSFLVVQRAVKPLLKKTFQAKLETPDFVLENGQPIVTIDNPFGKRDVRIRNSGGGVLKYSLDQWPDGLYIWPNEGERTLLGEKTQTLQIALAYGSKRPEYQFVLRSNVSEDQPVIVRVTNLKEIQANYAALASDVLTALSETLEDTSKISMLGQTSLEKVQEYIVDVVHNIVARRDPGLHEVGQWVHTAELMTAVNWSSYGAIALRRAEEIEPAIMTIPSIRSLAASTSAPRPLIIIETGLPHAQRKVMPTFTPFTSNEVIQKASAVSAEMVLIPALRLHGLRLQADVAIAKGEPEEASELYNEWNKESYKVLREREFGVGNSGSE